MAYWHRRCQRELEEGPVPLKSTISQKLFKNLKLLKQEFSHVTFFVTQGRIKQLQKQG